MIGMAAAVAATLADMIHGGTDTLTGWVRARSRDAHRSGQRTPHGQRGQVDRHPAVGELAQCSGRRGGGACRGGEYIRLAGLSNGSLTDRVTIATVIDVVIGSITFTGSFVAGFRQAPGDPPRPAGGLAWVRALDAVLAASRRRWMAGFVLAGSHSSLLIGALCLVMCALGAMLVLPIGGADMPVVISLLNSLYRNRGGDGGLRDRQHRSDHRRALVGVSGAILTKLMADAMNRRCSGYIPVGSERPDSTGTGGRGDGRQSAVEGRRCNPARLCGQGDHRPRIRTRRRPGAARGS